MATALSGSSSSRRSKVEHVGKIVAGVGSACVVREVRLPDGERRALYELRVEDDRRQGDPDWAAVRENLKSLIALSSPSELC